MRWISKRVSLPGKIRAGKHLDPGQKAILEAAKTELRKLYVRI